MRYKTTIEIVTEAKDKSEAIEMAGEYLSGNIISGVDMKCLTKPSYHCVIRRVGTVALSAVLIAGALFVSNFRNPQSAIQNTAGSSAIQPPLKTSAIDNKSADFKKQWQAAQTKEALNFLRK